MDAVQHPNGADAPTAPCHYAAQARGSFGTLPFLADFVQQRGSMPRPVAVIAILMVGQLTFAQRAPDFTLKLTDCKTTLGYVGPSDEVLKTVNGATSEFACTRAGQRINCEVRVAGEAAISKAEYQLGIDVPPSLYFQSSNGSDFFAVDLTTRRVVSISRYVSAGGEIVGAKVCHGAFSRPPGKGPGF